ncbi:TRAP transporter small permease [Photobacterium ganghwense]|uniref:TRAP transporter small permease n=1 Tax=Photobacterium ganghwense TaxID=320778 RepID=UPI001C2D14C8|nr:TRAP transporter small permease [Photobacterium ganghwense]MBV1839571.1 TRAP transporter small permease [Photobacterium ganghwense]
MKQGIHFFTQCWEWGARHLDRLLKRVAALLLFGLMTITCVDVVGRYFFDMPLTGSVELTELLLGSLIFATLPLITWRKEHISVDLTDSIIPTGVKRVRDALFSLAVAFSLVTIGIKIWDLAVRSQRYGEITEYLEIPLYYFIYFLAISCWLTAVTSLVLCITQFCGKQYDNQEDATC